jgi:ribonuclease-3
MSGEPAPPQGASAPGPEPVADGPGDLQATLSARLSLPLTDRATALSALTHKSWVNEHRAEGCADNERLEFLGDAVIDLAVSHRLMERFPSAREGELSKMRAAVVDEQGLAALAGALDLGPLLRLGRGEELSGGRRKASLLADAMEAVIAAVYLEHGLAAVLELVDRLLGEAFARAAAGTLDRDWKTQLQEQVQNRLRATPRYRVVAEFGPDHEKVFEVELEIRGQAVGRGTGRSKKDAEQAAARRGLEALAGGAFPPRPVEALTPVPGPTDAEGAALERPAGQPAPADAGDAPEGAPDPAGRTGGRDTGPQEAPAADPGLPAVAAFGRAGEVEPILDPVVGPRAGRAPRRRSAAATPRAKARAGTPRKKAAAGRRATRARKG